MKAYLVLAFIMFIYKDAENRGLNSEVKSYFQLSFWFNIGHNGIFIRQRAFLYILAMQWLMTRNSS